MSHADSLDVEVPDIGVAHLEHASTGLSHTAQRGAWTANRRACSFHCVTFRAAKVSYPYDFSYVQEPLAGAFAILRSAFGAASQPPSRELDWIASLMVGKKARGRRGRAVD